MATDSFRLFVATDWDAGFQLTPDTKPLDDVPPGGEYVAECTAAKKGVLDSVIVRDFTLDRLYVGKKFANLTADHVLPALGIINDRLYHLEPALPIAAGDNVRAVLKNISDSSKKPKVAVIDRSDQEVSSAAPRGWRVEGVHVGKAEKALSQSCPTCDSPDRDVRRQLADVGSDAGPFCADAWHSTSARKVAAHAPKLVRTLYDGPGNATLVNGCSCGAKAPNARAFANHVGVSEDAFFTMLALVSIIYDFYDEPTTMTKEEVARRVARCLEFSR